MNVLCRELLVIKREFERNGNYFEKGKFFAFAKEKLGALASEVKEEVAQKIIAKIEEEEAGAEVGMGAIFG